MPGQRISVRRLLLGSAILLCIALFAAEAAADDPAAAADLLPDLDQQAPDGLVIAPVAAPGPARYVIAFQSAVRNIGAGALIVQGHRAETTTPEMTGRQLIDRTDGAQRTVEVNVRLQYAVSRDHQHWHLLHFDRYELRRAGVGVLVRDSKTGFCLGDRYKVASTDVPAAPPAPRYTDRCGLIQRRLLSVTEGISPGYGDNYLPFLEGQSLPLTGLPAGRYVLTHRANPGGALVESNYANNAASVLLDLRWQKTRPRVTVLAVCPDTPDCLVSG
jgi:hypothetical protein